MKTLIKVLAVLVIIFGLYFIIQQYAGRIDAGPGTNGTSTSNGSTTTPGGNGNNTGGNNGTGSNGTGGATLSKCGFTITSHRSGATADFPLAITGIADRSRFSQLGCAWSLFEGQAGTAELYAYINNQGKAEWKLIAPMKPVQADSWMATTTAVHVTLVPNASNMNIPAGTPLKIVFKEEDAAGFGNPDTLELPLVMGKVIGGGQTTTLTLHFQDLDNINGGTFDCEETIVVTRVVPKTTAVADASLRIIFNEDLTELKPFYNKITINNKVATVDFDSGALKYLDSAACMQQSFKSPIEKTLKQFPTITNVQYSIDGKVKTDWDA